MIIFSNDGEANIQALTILGVSAKVGENRIGRFGTGWANAVSILLRYGQEVIMTIGTDKYEFGTVFADIRDSQFQIVTMKKNNRKAQHLGFTTRYGLNWTLADAYRELYCNAQDEDGTVESGSGYGLTKGLAGKTMVMVKGEAFEQVHKERDNIILNKSKKELLFSNDEIEIFRGEAPGLFYQGVRVSKDQTRFTYNIKKYIELSEDRTIKYMSDANYIIMDAVTAMDNQSLVEGIISAKSDHEGTLPFHYCYSEPSETFKNAVKVTRKEGSCNAHALELYYKKVADISEIYNVFTLNATQQAQWDRAINFLKVADLIPHIDKFELVFVDNFNRNQWGEAFKNKLVIGKASFEEGTKKLAAVIFEEYIHLQEKLADCTRDMQNYLFNTVMTMVEVATGDTI